MTNEPEQLRLGKALHRRIRRDWSGTVEDAEVWPEHGIALEFLPKKAKRIRRGRIDIFIEEISDFVTVVEIKGTDWDRIKPTNRIKLLGAHCRQVMKYVDKYLKGVGISVCAGIIYPEAPRTPGLREEVEAYLNDRALQVIWYDER